MQNTFQKKTNNNNNNKDKNNMRCYICNAILTPAEIRWNPKHKDWDPCTRCLEEIEAVFNDDTEEEIDRQLAFEFMKEEEGVEEEESDDYRAGDPY
jgi:hypothetical protein